MNRERNANKLFDLIMENKHKLVIGPSDLKNKKKMHFMTAKKILKEFSVFARLVNELNNEGFTIEGGTTSKGIPRLMIIPTNETFKEIRNLEFELGLEERVPPYFKKRSPISESLHALERDWNSVPLILLDIKGKWERGISELAVQTYPKTSKSRFLEDRMDSETKEKINQIPSVIVSACFESPIGQVEYPSK